MIVVERMIQQIYPGKNAELTALDKRWDAIIKSSRIELYTPA